jgi:hypothetical protein
MEGGELFKTAQMGGRVDSRSRIHRSHMRTNAARPGGGFASRFKRVRGTSWQTSGLIVQWEVLHRLLGHICTPRVTISRFSLRETSSHFATIQVVPTRVPIGFCKRSRQLLEFNHGSCQQNPGSGGRRPRNCPAIAARHSSACSTHGGGVTGFTKPTMDADEDGTRSDAFNREKQKKA